MCKKIVLLYSVSFWVSHTLTSSDFSFIPFDLFSTQINLNNSHHSFGGGGGHVVSYAVSQPLVLSVIVLLSYKMARRSVFKPSVYRFFLFNILFASQNKIEGKGLLPAARRFDYADHDHICK